MFQSEVDYELYMLQYHILDKQVKERMLTKMEANNTQVPFIILLTSGFLH